MYINQKFKDAITLDSPRVAFRIKTGNEIITSVGDGLLVEANWGLVSDGFIGEFSSSQLKVSFLYTDKVDYVGKSFEVEVGAYTFENDSYTDINWIPVGKYKVEEEGQVTDEILQQITLTMYNTPLAINDRYSELSFPLTGLQVRTQLAQRVGLDFSTSQKALMFDDYVFDAINVSVNQAISYREVFKHYAQLNLGSCYIDRSGKLVIKSVFNETALDETISNDDYDSLKNEVASGPINSIIYSNKDTGDGQDYQEIESKDETSISQNGKTSIKFSNNIFLDQLTLQEQQIQLDKLLTQVNGFSFTPFEINYFARPDFDPYDIIKLKDMKGNEAIAPLTNMEFIYNGGLTGTLKTKELPETLSKSDIPNIFERLTNAEIRVDRVKNEISLEVKDIESKLDTNNNGSIFDLNGRNGYFGWESDDFTFDIVDVPGSLSNTGLEFTKSGENLTDFGTVVGDKEYSYKGKVIVDRENLIKDDFSDFNAYQGATVTRNKTFPIETFKGGRNLAKLSEINEYSGGSLRAIGNKVQLVESQIKVISQLSDLLGFKIDFDNGEQSKIQISCYSDTPLRSYYKFDNGSQIVGGRLKNNNGYQTMELTIPEGATSLNYGIGRYPHPTPFTEFDINDLKIELGSTPTEYSPAPEDGYDYEGPNPAYHIQTIKASAQGQIRAGVNTVDGNEYSIRGKVHTFNELFARANQPLIYEYAEVNETTNIKLQSNIPYMEFGGRSNLDFIASDPSIIDISERDINITTLEYEDKESTPIENKHKLVTGEDYINFSMTTQEKTKYMRLMFDVNASEKSRVILTEQMFALGEPRTYFASNSETYNYDSQFLSDLDTITKDNAAWIILNKEAIDLESTERVKQGNQIVSDLTGKITVANDEINQKVEAIHYGSFGDNLNTEIGYMDWTGTSEFLYQELGKDFYIDDYLTYGLGFVSVDVKGSLSERGLEFFNIGKAIYKAKKIQQNIDYSFSAKVIGSRKIIINVKEYTDLVVESPKITSFTYNSPSDSIIFTITPKTDTTYIGLEFDVNATFTDRLTLHEMMFNPGPPKNYFYSGAQALSQSKTIRQQLSNSIHDQVIINDQLKSEILLNEQGIKLAGDLIQAQAKEIDLKVNKDGIIGGINASAETVKILSKFLQFDNAVGNNVDLTGEINATSGTIGELDIRNGSIEGVDIAVRSKEVQIGKTKLYNEVDSPTHEALVLKGDKVKLRSVNNNLLNVGLYIDELKIAGSTLQGGAGGNVNGVGLFSDSLDPIDRSSGITPVQNIGAVNARWNMIFLKQQPNVSSDTRIKKNILPIDKDFIKIFGDNVEPRTYIQNDKVHFGYVAQDIERALFKYATSRKDIKSIQEAKEYVKEFAVLNKSESYQSLLYGEIAVITDAYNRMKNEELETRIQKLEELLLERND